MNPAGKENFTAVYPVSDYALGVALANYLVDKNPKAVAVGQTATLVYAADQLVVGAKDTLVKRGASMAAVQDTDVTNLVTSFTQTTNDLALSHPDANALISCCDFAPLMDLPALKAAHRTDMTLMTRVDNPSTIQAMKAGADVVVAAFRTDRYNLFALDALAAYFAKKTPIPAGDARLRRRHQDRRQGPYPGLRGRLSFRRRACALPCALERTLPVLTRSAILET